MTATIVDEHEPQALANVAQRFMRADRPPHLVGAIELPGEIPLASGETIGHVHVTYETWGTRSPDDDNVVLICHALTGDSHVADGPDRAAAAAVSDKAFPGGLVKATGPDTGDGGRGAFAGASVSGPPADTHVPGWWSGLVGPGNAIDTNTYFVVCMNVLGGCSGTTGPLSPDPRRTDDPTDPAAPEDRYGLDFPVVTVEDMVQVEARVLDQLGIGRVLAVVGGSLGGMQALVWAREYPERVASCIAVATTWLSTPQTIAFNEVGRQSIVGDPRFEDGRYAPDALPAHGLAVARMIGHITYLSDESMGHKFGRRLVGDELRYTFGKEFQVESYLDHQGYKFVERFDADSYLYITRAIDYYALGDSPEDVERVFTGTPVRFLLLSFTSDWLFPTKQLRETAGALCRAGAEVTFAEIEASSGHDAFLLETVKQGGYVRSFLRETRSRDRLVAMDPHSDGRDGADSRPSASSEGGEC